MNRRIENLFVSLGEVLTHDYASPFDPLIKWVRNPAAILALAVVASALCGMFLHPRAFLLAAGLAAVLVVGTVWPWIAVRGLSGTLTFSRARVREGETVTTRVALRNRMPWGAWGVTIREAFPDGDRGLKASLAQAAGWRTTEACWEWEPACRGEYPRSILRITSAFPFGLWEASRQLAVSAPLLVWPRTFSVGPIPEAANGESGDGLAPRNKPGTSGDLLGVRPYRRGDAIRRIHWPQTARHGELVVCELQAIAVPRVQVVLDIGTDEGAGSDPDGLREWSIRVAASFAEDWIGQGAEVELLCGGEAVSARAGTVRTRQARILDALARLQPDGQPSLQDVLDGPACRRFERGLRVVVAPDRALRDLERHNRTGASERFVVLKAAAFGEEGPPEVGPLPVRPWIWVDDARRVPHLIHSGWKEVALGH
ncbi:MAG: DUF58 domain-containing protein [Isosphaeraceae bacterium]